MSSKLARKSKRASSRWTKSSAASVCRSKRQTILKSNCVKKWSPSTRFVRVKTWSAWKKLSQPPSRKSTDRANPSARRKRPSANQKRNRPSSFFSPAGTTPSKIKLEFHANPVLSTELHLTGHHFGCIAVHRGWLRELQHRRQMANVGR